MAWLGTIISVVTWLTRIGGVFAAFAAVLNGQTTVVNAHAVGSFSVPDILSTAYTILAAVGLSSTWLVPLKRITEWAKALGGNGNGQQSPAPSPVTPNPVPGPTPDGSINRGNGSLLSSIPLLELLAAGEAAVTWLSTKMPDKPVDFRFQFGGFEFEATVKPIDSTATLPQINTGADILKQVLERLDSLQKQQAAAETVRGVNPGVAMPAA